MPELTPAQTALLDQAHAAALAEQAALVARTRGLVAEYGPIVGAQLTKKLDSSPNPRRTLCALVRIVELEDRDA